MKRTVSLIAGILLAATMGGTALAGNGHGNGPKNGGNPNSQAGGLPALAAKVAALQTQVNSQGSEITTLQGQVGTLQGQVTDLQGQNNWAVVASTGTVTRNSGAAGSVTVTHVASSGIYEVLFSKDVSKCAYTASLDVTGVTPPVPVGYINVSGDSNSVDGVIVTTYDSTAAATDSTFDLYVSCP